MEPSYSPADGIYVLPSAVPIPGLGRLPVNAFVIAAKEPVLVDAGLPFERDAFLAELDAVIDPPELRWIWLTHVDPDHTGALRALVDEIPHLGVITSYLGALKLQLVAPVSFDRLCVVAPGQSVDLGDRRLVAVRPPVFDAPETLGLFDGRAGALYTVDCFGAALDARVEDARTIPPAALAAAQRRWAMVDAPWLRLVDRGAFARALDEVRTLAPALLLGSHLPPAPGLTAPFLATLAAALDEPPFAPPDAAALRAAPAADADADLEAEAPGP
jgi:flavorubredoxin